MERANNFIEHYRDIIANTPYIDSIYERFSNDKYKIRNEDGCYKLTDGHEVRFSSVNLKLVKAEHIIMNVLSSGLINDIVSKYRFS